MMSPRERLAYMADQIARNFTPLGHEAVVTATADHFASFWDPRMKRQAFALVDERAACLTPALAAALRHLRDRGAPPSPTRATEFSAVGDSGHSDAG